MNAFRQTVRRLRCERPAPGHLRQALRGTGGNRSRWGQRMSALSAGAAALYNRINAASSPDQLGELLTEIWRIHWPRDLSDSDAQFLVETIEKRKPGRGSVSAKPLAALRGRVS